MLVLELLLLIEMLILRLVMSGIAQTALKLIMILNLLALHSSLMMYSFQQLVQLVFFLSQVHTISIPVVVVSQWELLLQPHWLLAQHYQQVVQMLDLELKHQEQNLILLVRQDLRHTLRLFRQ